MNIPRPNLHFQFSHVVPGVCVFWDLAATFRPSSAESGEHASGDTADIDLDAELDSLLNS
jgi:hypothetical protein